VIATVTVGDHPHGLTITPDGKSALVCNTGAGTVSVVDVGRAAVVGEIAVPGANDVVIAEGDDHAYVVGRPDIVAIIDLDPLAVRKVLTVGNGPEHIVVGAAGGYVFVDSINSNDVSVIDPAPLGVRERITVEAGGDHQGLALGADGTRLYAVNHDAGSVSVIATGEPRLLVSIPVGDGPGQLTSIGDGQPTE